MTNEERKCWLCSEVLQVMDMAKKAILLLLTVMAVSGVSPTVYTVGDVGGWSSLRVVNYTEWAAAIEFQVGDILCKYQILHILLVMQYMVVFFFNEW